jgi:HK97 gp10 family phage protein
MTEVFKITGLDGTLDLLRSLPAEVVSKRGGPVKRALLKGARVIQQEAALNVARAVNDLDADGEEASTGLLQRSVIATRGKPRSGENGERYLVRVKRKKYTRNGEQVTTTATARWLEYGTSDQRQPAEPWLRPAFDKKKEQAVSTITTELLKELDRIVRKLGRQGGLS